MAFCSKCGAALQEGAKFCPECGAACASPTEQTGQAIRMAAPENPTQPKKTKKPVYKRWWFWVLIAAVLMMLSNAVIRPEKEVERPETVTSTSASQNVSAQTSAPSGTEETAAPAAAPKEKEPEAPAANEAAAKPEPPALPEEELKPAEADTQEPEPENEPGDAPEPEEPAPEADGIRPEVKEFLDAYEACMDEYADFMQKYLNADANSIVSLMGDYYRILASYNEYAEKIEALDQNELTKAELAYYLEVTGRVNQKLLSVAG